MAVTAQTIYNTNEMQTEQKPTRPKAIALVWVSWTGTRCKISKKP